MNAILPAIIAVICFITAYMMRSQVILFNSFMTTGVIFLIGAIIIFIIDINEKKRYK
jgi:hypothetical protein